MEWGSEPLQTKQVCEVSWAKNWTFSGLAWPVCLWVVSHWVIASLSERGWIATAKDSDSGRYMMVKQVGSPQKSMHPPFSDTCHRQFFLPPKVLLFFLFSGHHFFVKPLVFHDFPRFVSIFPAFSSRFSCSPAPSLFSKLRRRDDERHNVGRGKAWERTPEQPPAKRARCVGWFAWRRKWGPLGMAWLEGDFIQFYLVFFRNFGI